MAPSALPRRHASQRTKAAITTPASAVPSPHLLRALLSRQPRHRYNPSLYAIHEIAAVLRQQLVYVDVEAGQGTEQSIGGERAGQLVQAADLGSGTMQGFYNEWGQGVV